MKKIGFSSVILAIGCANWIIVIIFSIISIISIILVTLVSTTSPILYYYLIYSYIPTLISLVLTIKVKKEYRTINLTMNIIFLLLYIFASKILSNLLSHAT